MLRHRSMRIDGQPSEGVPLDIAMTQSDPRSRLRFRPHSIASSNGSSLRTTSEDRRLSTLHRT